MGMKTIYCVQPFWRDGRKLAHGELMQFRTVGEAERAAAKAYRRHAGVLVYSVKGCPEFDTWLTPRRVSRIGDIPPIEF